MTPTDFPEANITFTKPKGWGDEQCGSLRGFQNQDLAISAFTPTPEELADLNAGKPLWLLIHYGGRMVPVALTTISPFHREPETREGDATPAGMRKGDGCQILTPRPSDVF